jgi:hypothetical protein
MMEGVSEQRRGWRYERRRDASVLGSDFVQFFLVAYLGKDGSALGGIDIYTRMVGKHNEEI